MTEPNKTPDHDHRVIDFAAAKRGSKKARLRRRRRYILAGVIVAVVVLLGVFAFQFMQVVDEKDFWSNFSSSATT